MCCHLAHRWCSAVFVLPWLKDIHRHDTHSSLFNLITDLHGRVATLSYNNLENKTQQGCGVLVKHSYRQNDKLGWKSHIYFEHLNGVTIHFYCFYIQLFSFITFFLSDTVNINSLIECLFQMK